MNEEIEKILSQHYLTAKDLMKIIPHLSYQRALQYIGIAREEMKKQNYFVPEGRIKVALTKIIREKFGF